MPPACHQGECGGISGTASLRIFLTPLGDGNADQRAWRAERVRRNGMTVEDGLAVKRTHRGVDDARLQSLFATATERFMPRVELAARRLADATRHALTESVPATFERLLHDAKLPARLLPGILAAYQQEPRENAFGVSQALTLAAQDVAPEMRIELESLAGRYIAATEVLQ